MGLKEKTLKGVFWAFSQQLGVQVINFCVQIILARLLMPEDFGLIAMIQIFIAIGQTLMDGGMTSSLIRTKNVGQRDYSTVFYVNLFTSLLIYLILFLSAPTISIFFDQPVLTKIVRVLTLSFVIQALIGVQTTVLTRELKFKLLMLMQLPASIIGGIVGIVLAFLGYGVWSLVWLKLVTTFVFMIQHWFKTDWKPSMLIDKELLKYHFNFGYKLTLSGLLTTIYTNSYLIIIGKLFPAAQLGYYSQADTLRMFPVRNLTSTLRKVTYPIFSTIQDDDVRLKQTFKKITAIVFFIIVPVMLLLIVLAEPLFRLILTEKWLPAIPYFQILCISAIVYPLSIYNLNIILVKGKSNLYLKLEVIKKVSSVMFLLLIIPYGIFGVVYAQAISMFIHAFVNIHYSGKMIKYPMKEQLFDMLPIFMVGIISAVLCWAMDLFIIAFYLKNDLLRIILSTLSFILSYFVLSHIFKLNSVKDLRQLAKENIFGKLWKQP